MFHGRDEFRDKMAECGKNSKFELSFLHPKQSAIKCFNWYWKDSDWTLQWYQQMVLVRLHFWDFVPSTWVLLKIWRVTQSMVSLPGKFSIISPWEEEQLQFPGRGRVILCFYRVHFFLATLFGTQRVSQNFNTWKVPETALQGQNFLNKTKFLQTKIRFRYLVIKCHRGAKLGRNLFFHLKWVGGF